MNIKLKGYSKLLFVFAVFSALLFLLFGCNKAPVKIDVSTSLTLSTDFSGQRIINCSFPEKVTLSTEQRKALDEIILNSSPDNVKTSYSDVGDKASYKIVIDFKSKSEYEKTIEEITGKEQIITYSVFDNVLSKGFSIYESFDSLDLIEWIQNSVKENESLKFEFEQSLNPVVIVDGHASEKNFSTNGQIYAGTVKGYPVKSVSIETTNYKDNTYDRKIILTVPEKTYTELGQKLIDYMSSISGYAASTNWEKSGNNRVFTAIYKGIDYVTMQNITGVFLSSGDAFISYGDVNNSSTPLAEQSVFEENLSVLGFVAEEDEKVRLDFSYTLPNDVNPSDGIVLNDGVWVKKGKWEDGKYTVSTDSPVLRVKIPDGKQYVAKEINFELSNNGNKNFTKTISFVFDTDKGEKAFNYLRKWFMKLGLSPKVEINDDNLVCKLIFSGTIDEINKNLEKFIGSGNFISYEEKTSIMSVAYKIYLKDNINFDSILTGENSDIPMTYSIKQNIGENIKKFYVENHEEDYSTDSSGVSLKLISANSKINYIGTRPYAPGIILCSSIFVLIILVFAATVFVVNKKNKNNQGSLDTDIKLCVFDLDGTLINSISDLGNAVNRSLKKRGMKTHSIEKYKKFVGNGVVKLIERAAPESDPYTREEIKKEFDEYYKKHCLDETTPYDGCAELLEKLDEMGIMYGVLSNKPQEFVTEIINTLYPNGNFEFIYGKREGYNPKPDPQALDEILSIYNINPSECIYIGDSNVDIQTGKNSNTKTCGVLWGFRSEKELKNENPDIIIKNPLELIKLINK